MFNRIEYKKSALAALKNNWPAACLIAIVCLLLIGISNMAGAIVSTCVGGILSVGIISTFINQISFSRFLESIEDHWLNALLGALWNFLWVFLWSLLFFIPGVVAAYRYSMMFFVLAENKKISAVKAMNISKILTNGHKADLFMMDLSFLGWMFLSCLTFGIGLIWLYPYKTMAKTYAYYDLKKMAFSQGTLTPADFEE
jgi:uncharacterized membrane protein